MSGKLKHTPEPWCFEGSELSELVYYIENERGQEVKLFGDAKLEGKKLIPTPDTARALACVNALEGWADPSAAKELLEAAKGLIAYLNDGEKWGQECFQEAINPFKLIVARIEGRE